jgi:hypothetical protein
MTEYECEPKQAETVVTEAEAVVASLALFLTELVR